MTDKDKKYLIKKAGLCWHEMGLTPKTWWECTKCGSAKVGNNLDPLDPADMYGKIWVAFANWHLMGFEQYMVDKYGNRFTYYFRTLTSAPDLAQAMLEYFKEKEK